MEQQQGDAQKQKRTLETHLQTILVGLFTVAIVGAYTKMQAIYETVVRMEERDKVKTDQINTLQASVNQLRLDMADVKDRQTRIEASNKKP